MTQRLQGISFLLLSKGDPKYLHSRKHGFCRSLGKHPKNKGTASVVGVNGSDVLRKHPPPM